SMSYFQDGLWDIVLGLFLLGWGLTVMFDMPWLPGATFIAFFWLALGLKQKITYPRIGYAKPAEQQKKMIRIIIAGAVTLLLGTAVLLMVVTQGMPQFLHHYFEFLFGTMLSILIVLIGYLWGIIRWYSYAGLLFVSAAFNQWSGLSFELSFIIPGGIILLYGLNIFVRFLQKYPRVPTDGFDGN
ncbi:hypothetical protein ACFLTT_03740, partial [Chloroflexota bacterium]